MQMKYALKLRSKYTGDEIWLGGTYKTRIEAVEAVQRYVCLRCNYCEVVPVDENLMWVNKYVGFSQVMKVVKLKSGERKLRKVKAPQAIKREDASSTISGA